MDIGCGTGDLLYLLSKDRSLELHGIDLSVEMIKIAKEKLKSKAVLKVGSVSNLLTKYENNYFNYVFIEDAFHHLPEHDKLIIKIKSLLNKKGKLVICDLSFGKIGNLIFHELEPGNSKMYTFKGYKKLFEERNFKNIKQEKFGLVSVYTEGEK